MKVIVPLAGPDFVLPNGMAKSEVVFADDQPLLTWTLNSRSWVRDGLVSSHDFVFVLHDNPVSRRFAENKLSEWYPGSTVMFTSCYTQGAAFTALIAVAVLPDHLNEAICIDLADIYYQENVDLDVSLINSNGGGALALTFQSTDPRYSYLRLNNVGKVIECQEKKVISQTASAGTYWFRSAKIYLDSLSYVLENQGEFLHHNLYFVCPVLNGVIDAGFDVRIAPVSDVIDIKL
ncbi:MAG: hypothetical protein JJ850_09240 [Kordiimonadaceae bacterium]|nr:hypothetical protein [Kordiimonadaceae bacterium]MBO6569314.1 hypothetical protein [Kordiimonadaceae bacterium]MBO6964790.1 hypothetical protein [Kordiimonadaceae bacterium]